MNVLGLSGILSPGASAPTFTALAAGQAASLPLGEYGYAEPNQRATGQGGAQLPQDMLHDRPMCRARCGKSGLLRPQKQGLLDEPGTCSPAAGSV
jgi:hypothetical protein